VKPEQAPKGQSWKPTWPTFREGQVSSEKVDEASLDVPRGGTACEYTVRCATRETWSERDGDPNTQSERGEGQESEGDSARRRAMNRTFAAGVDEPERHRASRQVYPFGVVGPCGVELEGHRPPKLLHRSHVTPRFACPGR
jgi:hypothetical protein